MQVTFGHGARHLAGRGLSAAEVQAAIAEAIRSSVQGAHLSLGAAFWGRVTVKGQVIEYRAYVLDVSHVNVGTYYPVEP